jgi:hypothetical protein
MEYHEYLPDDVDVLPPQARGPVLSDAALVRPAKLKQCKPPTSRLSFSIPRERKESWVLAYSSSSLRECVPSATEGAAIQTFP